MAYGARLESVLGASPRGFESPILRRVMSRETSHEARALGHRPGALLVQRVPTRGPSPAPRTPARQPDPRSRVRVPGAGPLEV